MLFGFRSTALLRLLRGLAALALGLALLGHPFMAGTFVAGTAVGTETRISQRIERQFLVCVDCEFAVTHSRGGSTGAA